jgi:hypothetical protein
MHYSPVRHYTPYCYNVSFDLHVLATPPAFVLSQDQTLRLIPGSRTTGARTGPCGICFSDSSAPAETVRLLESPSATAFHPSRSPRRATENPPDSHEREPGFAEFRPDACSRDRPSHISAAIPVHLSKSSPSHRQAPRCTAGSPQRRVVEYIASRRAVNRNLTAPQRDSCRWAVPL